MKVCIYGAGCVGGVLASAIARSSAGHQVSLIARGPHLAAIQKNGLIVRTLERTEVTKHEASDKPADLGPQDLVIVATKTPALPEIARAIGPLLHSDTLVAFAQNGVFWFYGDDFSPGGKTLEMERLDPGGALHAEIGADRTLGIVCLSGGEIEEPGVVEATRFDGRFICGPAVRATDKRAAAVIGAVKPADLNLEYTSDVRRAMWTKYLTVAGNFGTCALTGGTIAQVHGYGPSHEVQMALVEEVHKLAVAHGFTGLGFDKAKLRANPSTSAHKPSLLQDLERGRTMEINSSYLILQDLAQQAGVPTPTIDVVAALLALRAKTAGIFG